MEKFIEDPRHIEIKLLEIVKEKPVTYLKRLFGTKETSEIGEETPSPFATDELRESMGQLLYKLQKL